MKLTLRLALLLLSLVMRLEAFSLLGPYEPWMDTTNGFRSYNGDIGGPMALGNEYRWNVPVLTYGFDQSFLIISFGPNHDTPGSVDQHFVVVGRNR